MTLSGQCLYFCLRGDGGGSGTKEGEAAGLPGRICARRTLTVTKEADTAERSARQALLSLQPQASSRRARHSPTYTHPRMSATRGIIPFVFQAGSGLSPSSSSLALRASILSCSLR